jgi:hypothetical protein
MFTLDNAQSTPHVTLTDKKGVIKVKIDFCSNGVLINGKPLEDFPPKDNIVLSRLSAE